MLLRGPQLALVLCLMIRRVICHFFDNNEDAVSGILNKPVILKCFYLSADNRIDKDVQVLWFKNFTTKVLDCMVMEGKKPTCQNLSFPRRTRLSGKALDGDASLELSRFQESDVGSYQCWVIFSDSYHRQDIMLKKQDAFSDALFEESHSEEHLVGWNNTMTHHFLLMSGWFIALLLAGIIITNKYFLTGKRRYTIAI
ncbi:uncharacterized protein O3C94_018832 isoform 1-T2 [Discoglossus pictus]